MFYYEECEKTGEVKKRKCKDLPSGKFKLINGDWWRVGDSRAIPDEPFSNKSIQWDNGVKSMADGRHYTNKADYMDSLNRAGMKVL